VDAAQRLNLAFIALRPKKQLYATAVRLYTEAFGGQPELTADPRFGHRYHAAWAAALAGTGQGKDVARLDATDRAELRYRALCWLQDDLARLQLRTAAQLRRRLLHWRQAPDLAAVRDPTALGKLPEAEQVAWLSLWAQVDALLAATAGTGK
jgi:hypothetical protein